MVGGKVELVVDYVCMFVYVEGMQGAETEITRE
jgi:hypothetical protein